MKQSITMLTEVKKSIRGYDYEGVHYVTCGDQGTNRPIVVREVDPAKLRQKYNNNKKENGPQTVELNRGKKVEIFSPLPKKHEDEEKKKENRSGREGNKKKEAKDEPKEEPQVKKFKEEKSKNKEGEKKNKDEQNKSKKTNKDDGRNKDVKQRITMTLKQGCKCVDCASKVMNYIRGLEGVESVNGDSWDQNRLTVIGKVDPIKLQEMVEQKTHKKITLSCDVCPLPEKDKDDNKENGGAAEESRNKEAKDKPKENPEEKNSEPPVTTAVLKVHLHCEQCEGCIKKIKKIISNIEGYHKVTIDCAQDLVIVKGSMDMKALGESLKQQLKKDVQIVLTKEDGKEKEKKCGREGKTGGDGGRDGEKKRKSGGKKKEKGSGAEESGREEKKGSECGRDDDKASKKKERNGGEKEKEEGDRKTGGEVGGDGGEQVEQYQFAYQYQYHSPYHFYAPQMFSDENPNACSIL